MKELKIRLRRAMDLKGITQVELSEKTGIPKSSINQYLSGYAKPKDERVSLLAQALGVTESWLIGYGDSESDHYYTSTEVRELANRIYQDDNLRILFDAAKDVSADEIKAVVNILEQFKKTRR